MALRVLAPNAIRPIEDLVPLLYPGVKVSYGTIQQMLVEAEARAARFNAQASLGGVEAGALDEMFSQGEPVLAGVDLDSGYLFGLSLSATRDGEAWAVLTQIPCAMHVLVTPDHELATRTSVTLEDCASYPLIYQDDSGSQIDIESGGIGKIRVADDGCGIAKEDLALAFERHAKSKIESAADRRALDAYGVRSSY